jgi:hypothetical protein
MAGRKFKPPCSRNSWCLRGNRPEDQGIGDGGQPQLDRQPHLANDPKNTSTTAIKSHGEPVISSTMPHAKKKAITKNVKIASAKFIART